MKERTIFALGYFDGVHLGHQSLLTACRSMAEQKGYQSGAVTFLGHPEQLLRGRAPAQINTPADRGEMLRQQVNTVLELPFDTRLMETPWDQFLEKLAGEYGAAGFVCGSDFRFGQRGQGTAELLQKFCRERKMSCRVVPQKTLDGIRISSTHIRQLLEKGCMEEAARFLGHPHILSGTVVRGKQLGRTIDVPTANVEYPEELVAMPHGVYACLVTVEEETYTAVVNLGCRPTVNGSGINVESWLQDFSGDLYGKTVQIRFIKFLRPEKKFPDLSALQKQIGQDKKEAEKALKSL